MRRHEQWNVGRPERSQGERTAGVIVNKVGERLGPIDDIPPSDNEDYESDFVDKENDEPIPDSSYHPTSQDESGTCSQSTPPEVQGTAPVLDQASDDSDSSRSLPSLET